VGEWRRRGSSYYYKMYLYNCTSGFQHNVTMVVFYTYSDTRLIDDGFDGPTMACTHERTLQLQLPWVRTKTAAVSTAEKEDYPN